MSKFISKPAIAIYVGVAILIATAFGLGDQACSLANSLGFVSELCTVAE